MCGSLKTNLFALGYTWLSAMPMPMFLSHSNTCAEQALQRDAFTLANMEITVYKQILSKPLNLSSLS